MPSPEPTQEQIEAVREIALLYSYEQTEQLVNGQPGIADSGLNDAQWAATLADVAEWAKVKNKHTRIEGDGVKIDKDRNRLNITNRVRRRLRLFAVDESGAAVGGSAGDYVTYTAQRRDDYPCK